MMQAAMFLIWFLLFCCSGSLCLCGIYVVTRKGRIFGFWSEYWEAKKEEGITADQELQTEKDALEYAQKTSDLELVISARKIVKEKEEWILFLHKTNLYWRRPSWLVHPLSGCVYCFASVYGSLFYWIVGSVVTTLTAAPLTGLWTKLVLWIVFCLTVSALNGILIKKII